ncbi:restriction system modified-DNA reader domain-containing protein [Streptomyces sp. NPDC055078]
MSSLTVPSDWSRRADVLKRRVADCGTDKIKIAGVFKSSPHWARLRPQIIDLADRKCWYCEGEVSNSRLPIDHFRPKNGVVGEVHPGYYWLAYEVSNFRLICEFCNSSTDDDPTGRRVTKIHHFPLLNPASRLLGPGMSVEREIPVLLDPVVRADCDLLDFDGSGAPRRNDNRPSSALERAVGVCRVKESIRIYGLDRPGLKERRSRVMRDVTFKAGVLDAPVRAEGALEMLRELIEPKAPHSSAALSALRSCRDLNAVVENFPDELGIESAFVGMSRPEALTVSDLITSGSLKAGIELVGDSDFGEVIALLLPDGGFELGARSYATPTSAARAATGSAEIDGWDFWNVAVSSGRVSLSQIRSEFNEDAD